MYHIRAVILMDENETNSTLVAEVCQGNKRVAYYDGDQAKEYAWIITEGEVVPETIKKRVENAWRRAQRLVYPTY